MGLPAISPKLGIAILICTLPSARAKASLCAPHTTRVRSAITLWTTGKHEPTSHGSGCSRTKSLQCSNAVRPNALHGDDSESFAVSLQESMRGCSSRILRPSALLKCAYCCDGRQHEGGAIIHTPLRPRMKSSCPPRPGRTERGLRKRESRLTPSEMQPVLSLGNHRPKDGVSRRLIGSRPDPGRAQSGPDQIRLFVFGLYHSARLH